MEVLKNDLDKIYKEGKKYKFTNLYKSKKKDGVKIRVAKCIKKYENYALFDFGKYLECMSYVEPYYEIKEYRK